LGGSGCDAVFVDEPVTGGGSSDLLVEFDHGRVALIVGCSLAETTVGSVLVVVGHELFEEPTQLALVPDQGPVQEFVADGANPAFGEGVGSRSAGWDGDDAGPDRGEHVIESPRVLAGAVADHEPDRLVEANWSGCGRLGWSTRRSGWW